MLNTAISEVNDTATMANFATDGLADIVGGIVSQLSTSIAFSGPVASQAFVNSSITLALMASAENAEAIDNLVAHSMEICSELCVHGTCGQSSTTNLYVCTCYANSFGPYCKLALTSPVIVKYVTCDSVCVCVCVCV